jgi:predicted 2-oxoglutarate/Fe(II)-dependent dioxygenase YbiX
VPTAEFFTRLGLFVARDFLDPDTCAHLRQEVKEAEKVPGAVGAESGRYEIDPQSRRTNIADVAADAEAVIDERLSAITPEIERHFSVRLEGRQRLQFLLYREGDFFEAHRDRNPSPDAAEFSRRRQVSVVVFLNGEAEEPAPDAYGGGSLTFYGLLGEQGDRQVGLPVVGETGLLVAFDSNLTHAVTPVTHGERYTVVTWLV